MANFIENELEIIGDPEDVDKVLDFIKVEGGPDIEAFGKGTIDFNKIDPEPDNIEDWYDWRMIHWGVRWNAECIDPEGFSSNPFSFFTPWSGVTNLMVKLSKMFPTVELHYAFADEDDYGNNVGQYVIENGEIIEDNTPDESSKAAYDLATSITGISPEENGMVYDKNVENYV